VRADNGTGGVHLAPIERVHRVPHVMAGNILLVATIVVLDHRKVGRVSASGIGHHGLELATDMRIPMKLSCLAWRRATVTCALRVTTTPHLEPSAVLLLRWV